MAVELGEEEVERKQTGPEPDESATKRACPAAAPGSLHPAVAKARNKKGDAATAKIASLGLFKKGGGRANTSQQPTFEPMALAKLETLRGVEAGTLKYDLTYDGVLKWWEKRESSYPLLARAARVVFGAPASAAVLERDFTDAYCMMTSSRSAADVKDVEMILFLHENLDLIS